MSRSQFEEMTMLGLARRAERDRQRDGDRRENGALLEDDDEDTKVYRWVQVPGAGTAAGSHHVTILVD